MCSAFLAFGKKRLYDVLAPMSLMSRIKIPKISKRRVKRQKKSKKSRMVDRDDLLVTLLGIILPAPNNKKGKGGEER